MTPFFTRIVVINNGKQYQLVLLVLRKIGSVHRLPLACRRPRQGSRATALLLAVPTVQELEMLARDVLPAVRECSPARGLLPWAGGAVETGE